MSYFGNEKRYFKKFQQFWTSGAKSYNLLCKCSRKSENFFLVGVNGFVLIAIFNLFIALLICIHWPLNRSSFTFNLFLLLY